MTLFVSPDLKMPVPSLIVLWEQLKMHTRKYLLIQTPEFNRRSLWFQMRPAYCLQLYHFCLQIHPKLTATLKPMQINWVVKENSTTKRIEEYFVQWENFDSIMDNLISKFPGLAEEIFKMEYKISSRLCFICNPERRENGARNLEKHYQKRMQLW